MQNYLMLNGKQIELTEEQIESIKQSLNVGDVELSTFKPAEIVRIGKYEFIVLEQLEDRTVVLLKGLLQDEEQFGKNNNYDGSNVDERCNGFGQVIEKLVGADNLVEHTVDLTADDGLKCYGSVKRKMSLLTAEQYRKYVYLIDEYKLDKWWWLSTAFSTPKHDDAYCVECVSPHGYFNRNFCNYYDFGVRPFCILKSNIFVSK